MHFSCCSLHHLKQMTWIIRNGKSKMLFSFLSQGGFCLLNVWNAMPILRKCVRLWNCAISARRLLRVLQFRCIPFICYKNSLTKHYFLPFVISRVLKTFLPAIKHRANQSINVYSSNQPNQIFQ